jgi:hypothetical protein
MSNTLRPLRGCDAEPINAVQGEVAARFPKSRTSNNIEIWRGAGGPGQ